MISLGISQQDIEQLQTVTELAKQVPSVGSGRVAAGLYMRNKLISTGACQLKTHPLQKKFAKNPLAIFLHAEIDALRNALQQIDDVDDLKKMTLVVARVKYDDNMKFIPALAKPCLGCQKAIKHFGIKRLIYTTG